MLATAGHQAPYWVCAVYLVLLAIVGIAAAMFMDNLDHGIEVNHVRSILFERDTYVISLFYICTFGSWIGFAFAFGQVLQVNFLANGETAGHAALHAAQIAFVGPLLGSVARIYGGRLADRLGGGRVTLGVLGGMILAAGLLVGISSVDDHGAGTRSSAPSSISSALSSCSSCPGWAMGLCSNSFRRSSRHAAARWTLAKLSAGVGRARCQDR